MNFVIQHLTLASCLKFQAERQKAFYIFLKQFLVIYKNWEPCESDCSSEVALSGENSQHPDEVIIGCSAAHPAEIIVVLIEEVTHITTMVTECKLTFHFLNLYGNIFLWIKILHPIWYYLSWYSLCCNKILILRCTKNLKVLSLTVIRICLIPMRIFKFVRGELSFWSL